MLSALLVSRLYRGPYGGVLTIIQGAVFHHLLGTLGILILGNDEGVLICNLESVLMPQGYIHRVVAENLRFSHAKHWSFLWERTLLGRQWSSYSI
jgi:hypothetical protein